jgi:Ca-activated chloride channel family protein
MTTLSPALLPAQTSSGTVVTADGRTLPLRTTRLVVRAAAGLAQVRLVQTFANPYAETLHVTYQLPLPADAAVGGFEFRLGGMRVVGDIDRRAAARDRFEQAIASGRTAALLEQDRSSLFHQELGNLPPGAELEAVIEIDQPLQWVADGWQWRFPTTVAPRYLGAAGRVDDAHRIATVVADPAAEPLPPRCELDLVIDEAGGHLGAPTSPSHALQLTGEGDGCRIAFAAPAGRVPMDRDVVVQWPVAAPQVGATLQAMRVEHGPLAGQAFGLLTLVPPRADTAPRRRARDLIVLLDVSGSMQGAPLAQAREVTAALVRSLGAEDRLELIAFASRPLPWGKGPQVATEANKAAALAWLQRLQAGGGTEMHSAILASLAATRRGAQRQVVVVTDGLIGFEREIVGTIRTSLPANSRVHVVGIGAAPNRTLTRGASRAGRGLEVLIGIDEDPAPAAARLLARTAAPLVDELTLRGSALLACAPRALPDLTGGAPVRLLLHLQPQGGSLLLQGTTADAAFRHELTVPPVAAGGSAAIARGFGRESVEDLEVELAATGDPSGIDARIEHLGLAHRIATRMTSWVAIAAEATVDPRTATRREQVPHQLPYGMSIAQLGLRGHALPTESLVGDAEVAAYGRLSPPAPASAKPAPSGIVPSGGAPTPSDGDSDDKARRQESAPPTPPRKKSFFERLRRDAARPAVPGTPVPSATLRRRSATEWVFECLGLSTWQLPDRVVVVFADGSERELAVAGARTTAAGAIAAGGIVRLVLATAAGAPMPTTVAVRLRLVTGTVTLELPIA